MKKFIKKILLFFSVILIPFLIVELIITIKQKNNFIVTTHNDWHTLEGHNSEVLFIGNSRVWTHFDANRIGEYINAPVEDLAQDGQSVNMLWYKFQRYLDVNEKPKEIYVLVDPFFIRLSGDLYKFDRFRSYMFMDRYDLGPLKELDGWMSYYKYMPLTAVGEQAFDFLMNKSDNEIDFAKSRGFKAFELEWDNSSTWTEPIAITYEKDGSLPYVDSFTNFCAREDIRCYFIFTPMSYPAYNVFTNYDYFKQVLNERGVDFRDYNGEMYDDSTLFYNHMHLNTKGVDIFMKQFLADSTVLLSYR